MGLSLGVDVIDKLRRDRVEIRASRGDTARANPLRSPLFGQAPASGAQGNGYWFAAALASAVGVAAIVATLWVHRPEGPRTDQAGDARVQFVTDSDGLDQAAAISRDGRVAAFLSNRDGQTDVWVTRLGSGQFRNLTNGAEPELINPSVRTLGFAPDGESVTCWVRRPDANGTVEIGIRSIPTTGGASSPYLDDVAEFDWTRDRSLLVYHTTGPGDLMFVTSDAQHLPGTRIFAAPAGLHAHYPVWSIDRAFIYFVQERDARRWFGHARSDRFAHAQRRARVDARRALHHVGGGRSRHTQARQHSRRRMQSSPLVQVYSTDPSWPPDGMVAYSGPDIGTTLTVTGDTAVDIAYSNYRDFGGVLLPGRIVRTQGGHPVLDITVSSVTANAQADIAVPAAVRDFTPPSVTVSVDKLANGVYYLKGGSHHSLAIDQRDHIIVVEAPQSEARSEAVIAKVKEVIPNKPIRYIVNTHVHFDHSGGLRTARRRGRDGRDPRDEPAVRRAGLGGAPHAA